MKYITVVWHCANCAFPVKILIPFDLDSKARPAICGKCGGKRFIKAAA